MFFRLSRLLFMPIGSAIALLCALPFQAAPASTYRTIVVSLPDGTPIYAEVADTFEKRVLGLMYRTSLAVDRGMIFLMEEPGFHAFHMKNCKIPLDIIWLNGRRQIVHLERNLPPCETAECPSYPPSQKSLYVLELRAGSIDRKKLAIGQTILFDVP